MGSRCFLFDSFRNSCRFSRHSRSNHFLLDVVLIRLRDFLVLISRHIFDVAVRMFRVSSSYNSGSGSSSGSGSGSGSSIKVVAIALYLVDY